MLHLCVILQWVPACGILFYILAEYMHNHYKYFNTRYFFLLISANSFIFGAAHSAGAVEYTDYTSAEG